MDGILLLDYFSESVALLLFGGGLIGLTLGLRWIAEKSNKTKEKQETTVA
jgi:F0F1-type ATP synthase assembly protein I